MPELPEVETVANGVHARVHNQRILSVWTSNKPQTFKTPPDEIVHTLTNAHIDRVHRVGKTIVVDLTRREARKQIPVQFLVHLGMTGRLLVNAPDVPHPPHTHAILTLSSGQELRFIDPRRFGRLSIYNPKKQPATDNPQPLTSYAGPGREPLTIPLEDFIALFRNRKTPIKAALLNQKLLHGVGNIYADEALFRARIRPTRHAGRLTRDELARLRESLIKVLKHAIKLGGSSVSDYVDAEGAAGFFQLHHNVYSRTGEPCRTCATPIKRTVIGGRSTHFCPTCQR
jgi:formamidopyrimidine-DNA glycosylase